MNFKKIFAYLPKIACVTLLMLAVVIGLTPHMPSAHAEDIFCPPLYHCYSPINFDQVLNCPQGKLCVPIFPPPPGCPPVDICYLQFDNPLSSSNGSSATSTTSSTASGGSSTSATVTFLSQYFGTGGTEITAYGSGFTSSTIVVFSNAEVGNFSVTPSSVLSNKIVFVIPTYLPSGGYTVAVGTQSTVAAATKFNFTINQAPSTYTAPAYVPAVQSTYYNQTNVNQTPSTSQNTAFVPSTTSGGFAVGQRVQVLTSLKVRSASSLSGSILTIQNAGTLGTIVSPGVFADGYTWVKVKYDSGIIGWSASTFLTSNIRNTSTTGTVAANAPSTFSLSLSDTTLQKGSFNIDGLNSSLCFNFKQNLFFGAGAGSYASLSKDVNDLQTALIAQGFSINDYERGQWANFGASTLVAAIKFQDKYGITPDAGYVGPLTRAKLNSLYNCY
ncbi:MAG TPA: hypothetical protein VL335_01225 [Candidatus Paceibacterota bacterium]|jgi:hypothetical protein|nr:hypothetical protein [Candidatus Paceibacterota bacterium]